MVSRKSFSGKRLVSPRLEEWAVDIFQIGFQVTWNSQVLPNFSSQTGRWGGFEFFANFAYSQLYGIFVCTLDQHTGQVLYRKLLPRVTEKLRTLRG